MKLGYSFSKLELRDQILRTFGLKKDVKIAEEFWDFLGEQGTYQQLLDIFEHVGIELRPEIDDYFARYNR